MTRREALARCGCACLATGLAGPGCARLPALDADAGRPPGAPKNFIAREEEVNPTFHFFKGALKGVLVRTQKGIVGYENKCSHQGAPTALKGGALTCVWHGSAFEPATGKPVKGPATEPLTPLKLEVRDGWVLLSE